MTILNVTDQIWGIQLHASQTHCPLYYFPAYFFLNSLLGQEFILLLNFVSALIIFGIRPLSVIVHKISSPLCYMSYLFNLCLLWHVEFICCDVMCSFVYLFICYLFTYLYIVYLYISYVFIHYYLFVASSYVIVVWDPVYGEFSLYFSST